MKNRFRINIVSLVVISLFTGCSQHELTLANSLANSAIVSSGTQSTVGNNTVKNMLSSSNTQQGFVQSQVIGAQMMMNPAVVGAGALASVNSVKNMEQNKASFNQITELAINSDQANNSMQNMMVSAYNKKHGTNFKSFTELQDSTKVSGYNEQHGTNFKTLTEVREHYNKAKGTNFKTDQELRDYIAANR